jgi:alanine dehydrogenase
MKGKGEVMQVGIPREIKPLEGRVGLIPEACGDLIHAGHEVFLEKGAGEASGFSDKVYQTVGVKILPDTKSIYKKSKLIVKVKEPIEPELGLLQPDHLLFSFLHLAAEPALSKRLQKIGLTAIGFETVQEPDGLPILCRCRLAPICCIVPREARGSCSVDFPARHGARS